MQAASGLAFAGVAAAHRADPWLAPLGAEVYDGFQSTAHAIDPQPAVAIRGVALPLLVPVAAGLRRMRLRGLSGRSGGRRMRLHRLTGHLLLLVIVGRVAAVRGSSLVNGAFPASLARISFSLAWRPGSFYVHCTRGFGVELTR